MFIRDRVCLLSVRRYRRKAKIFKIQRERGSAAELLSLMSFFNPQGIPESTLQKYSKRKAELNAAEDREEADNAFNEDLDTLQAYSLVSITTDNACEMHALVQFCTRVWLSSFGDAAQWEQKFVALMAQELPSGEYENWAKCQQLLPHVESLFKNEPAGDEALKAWAQVLSNAAWYLWMQGRYSTVQQIAAKALAAREDVLGLDAYQTVKSVVVLAVVLQAQGKYEEAETLSRRALEGREKELGERHPDTLTSMYCLAYLLHTLRRYTEAAELYQRACDGRAQQLSPDHPRTVACRNRFIAMQQEAASVRLVERRRSLK
jgi:tetratricopeptide (TPR) repeat protein